MARDKISIQLPVITNTTSVGVKTIEKKVVTQANGIELVKAQECMRNTLQLVVENTATADKTVTFKAGGRYPNAMRGDLVVPVTSSSSAVCIVQDPSQFVNADGSILLDFEAGFTGNVYAIAKPTGIAQ